MLIKQLIGTDEGWGHQGGVQAPRPGSPAWVLHMGFLGRNSSEQGPLWLRDTPTPFCSVDTPSPPREAHGVWTVSLYEAITALPPTTDHHLPK